MTDMSMEHGHQAGNMELEHMDGGNFAADDAGVGGSAGGSHSPSVAAQGASDTAFPDPPAAHSAGYKAPTQSFVVSTTGPHQNNVDVEAGSVTSVRGTRRLTRLIEKHLDWFYIALAVFLLILLGLTADVVNSANHNYGNYRDVYIPSYYYTKFAPTKELLAASCLSFLALIYIFCTEPYRERNWTKYIPKLPWKMNKSVVAHLIPWALMFGGACGQASWLNETCYSDSATAPGECGYLLPPTRRIGVAIDVFAFFCTALWSLPTFLAVRESMQEFRRRD